MIQNKIKNPVMLKNLSDKTWKKKKMSTTEKLKHYQVKIKFFFFFF